MKWLAHIVLDDVHFVLTSDHYSLLKRLWMIVVPFCHLSTTAPLMAAEELCHPLISNTIYSYIDGADKHCVYTAEALVPAI